MPTDGGVATMFDSPSSSVLFVSGSEQFTRTFIDETIDPAEFGHHLRDVDT